MSDERTIHLDELRALRADQPLAECTFCGRGRHEVIVLVGEPGRFICDMCFAACADAMLRHADRVLA